MALTAAVLLAGCMPGPAPEDPDRFLALGEMGQPLADGEGPPHCILDRHTELVWAVPRAGSDLLDPAHTYTWFNPVREANAGDTGLNLRLFTRSRIA